MDAAGTLFVEPTPGRSAAVVGSIGITGLFRARSLRCTRMIDLLLQSSGYTVKKRLVLAPLSRFPSVSTT